MDVEPLSGEPPFGGSAFQITAEMVQNAASMMRVAKTAGPLGDLQKWLRLLETLLMIN